MEPGILLKKESQRIVAMNDLNAVRRVDAPRHSERQTTAGVISVFFGIIRLPLLQSPVGEWKIVSFRRTFGIRQWFSLSRKVQRHSRHGVEHIGAADARHIRRIWVIPVSAEVRFAVGKTWHWSSRRQIGVSAT